jgi:CRISPR-associated protein Cas1
VRRISRATGGLARLVVLGGSGSISLEALRWLAGVGAALVCLDRDARLLCTSAPSRSEAKLRRAQALAPFNQTGVEVARLLLTRKLEGQLGLLEQLAGADGYRRRLVADRLAAIRTAETLAEMRLAEAEAAAAYWRCWRDVQLRLRPADQRRLPDHWGSFGTRTSPIGGGPRLAVTPAGAILNYLYALLEAEARLACLQLGLDPALAVIHADLPGRDSLPLDLMEALRPNIDRYLLALLRDRVFRAADFHETGRGNCRLLPPLTRELAETLPAWRRLVGPVAEQTARLFLQAAGPAGRAPTPLSQENRRADRDRRSGRPTHPPTAARPARPERRCHRCGGPLPHRDRTYCDTCLPHYQHDRYQAFRAAGQAQKQAERAAGTDPSHGGDAAARRGATRRTRAAEQAAWEKANPHVDADRTVFEREILPLIQEVSLSQLARATGLTGGYLAQVRRGAKVPHQRHWPALRRVGATLGRQGRIH